ncbi:MAG TPA: thiamine pyrophosphate-dependent enzyme [Chitinivibrionales bacterium]|jgi:2-oxoglutarate ferredoxin oxidoreductase subunit beta|nr:thiamine pyrophosphate-dependent enzyme [Chitinivibrionales bacterium]
MNQNPFDKENPDIAWCPGCGNYSILDAIKQAVAQLGITPQNLVVACGIGQAPKTPHYFNTNMFNGLHGRALPAATAIKAANPSLTVIAEGGDGDMYGEGGNHFIHTVRRNPDITHLVHDNMVYGLTKGQASPTSERGFVTPVQVDGVTLEPFNPIAVALALDASFVARAFAGDIPQTVGILKKAILHKGYALVDIFQPCVTYNKVNTFKWFKDNTYYLDETHDTTDRVAAFSLAIKTDKYPLGVFHVNAGRIPFEEACGAYKEDKRPLFERNVDAKKVAHLMERVGRS